MTPGLQLILPGLFDLPLYELEADFIGTELPCLNRILGRATPLPNQDYSVDAMLGAALALPATDTGLPLARAFAENPADADRVLLVEAIHLHAELHGALAMPIPHDDENLKDIAILINDLNDVFKVDLDISAVADGLYRMRLQAFDPPTHYPHPLSVLGKSVSPWVEQSRQVLPWYQLQNEIQMFLHQHAINAQRLRRGRLPINSLWVWGAGAPTQAGFRPCWYGDDAALNHFAAALDLPVAACSALGPDSEFEHAIVVDLRLLRLLKSGFDARLDELLLDIENNLLKPVMQILTKSSLPLRLRAGFRCDFEMKPSARFKFWRGPGSLADWSQ